MAKLDDQMLWNFYSDIFQSDYAGDKNSFTSQNWNTLNELKNSSSLRRISALE